MKILLATGNENKVREIKAIFKVDGVEFLSIGDFRDLPEVVEDQESFEGNAVKKARTLARASGLTALADDSGLEVMALGGEPGVYSARYAGPECDDNANIEKLLGQMEAVQDRAARFRCVIALASPSGISETVSGECTGSIALQRTGANGFGYDPVFIPDGHHLTFAQLDSAAKNRISHRGAALEAARVKWIIDRPRELMLSPKGP